MNINKPLISILSTAFLLTGCESLPNVKISIEDNQSEEKTSVPTLSAEAESEVATTTDPQSTAEVRQNSSNDKPV